MPDFGFDPIGLLRVQLENQKNNSPLDAFSRGMNQGVDLRSKQTDLAEKQASLANMLYGQQQQRSLADVGRQNQGAFNSPLARGLAGIGNLGAANEAEQQDIQRQQLRQKMVDIHTDVTRSRLRAAKTPDQIDNVLASTDEGVRNLYGLPQSSKDEGAQDKIDGFVALGISQEKQAENAAKQRELDIKQQLANRDRIFNGKNGETISFDPNTGEAITLRGPPPAKTTGAGFGATGKTPPGMTQSQLDEYARNTNVMGEVPKGLPRGAAGMMYQTAIRARAEELRAQGGDQRELGEISAGYQADKGALHHLQTQADTINSYTRTFDKNITIADDALKKLQSSDFPLLNKGLRAWENVSGNPDATALQNALNTVRSEAAKINSGATGAGGAPMTVLDEMEKGLPNNATPAQTLAAFKVYLQDSKNRRDAMNEQMTEIKGRLSGKSSARGGAQGTPPATPSGGKPDIRARLTQLRQSGAAAADIKNTLSTEYTPDEIKAAASK